MAFVRPLELGRVETLTPEDLPPLLLLSPNTKEETALIDKYKFYLRLALVVTGPNEEARIKDEHPSWGHLPTIHLDQSPPHLAAQVEQIFHQPIILLVEDFPEHQESFALSAAMACDDLGIHTNILAATQPTDAIHISRRYNVQLLLADQRLKNGSSGTQLVQSLLDQGLLPQHTYLMSVDSLDDFPPLERNRFINLRKVAVNLRLLPKLTTPWDRALPQILAAAFPS